MHAKIVCARRLVIVHQIFIQFTMKSKQNNFSGFFKNPYMKIFAANKRWFSGWLSENFGWKERDRPHIWSYAIIQKLCQYIKYYQLVHHEKRKKESEIEIENECVSVCVAWCLVLSAFHIEKYSVFNGFSVQTNICMCECVCLIWCKNIYFGNRSRGVDLISSILLHGALLCITSNTSPVLPFKRSSWLHLFEVSRIKTFSSIWWVDLNVYLSNCILIWMRY